MQCHKMISAIAAISFLMLSVNVLAADKKTDKQDSKASVDAEKTGKNSGNAETAGSAASGAILSPSEMEKRGRAKR